jgi:hypothetical protein
MTTVPVMVVDGSAPGTFQGLTREQAFVKRFADERDIDAGGIVPNSGLRSSPRVLVPDRRMLRR